jgi:orotidine-5'-phosphate decarboxylase
MNRQQLTDQIKAKKSFLCVGLDTDINKIPEIFKKETYPLFAFNKAIIDATKDYCVAYKPNVAFYEAYGSKGWEQLEMTAAYIPDTHFSIADAKRGDIGTTSNRYAEAFFQHMDFDSVTVAPYMGADSVKPFLEYENKWVILLALTSNAGSADFQTMKEGDELLYERVLRKASTWGNPDQLMFVVGATHPDMFADVRKITPEHFLLVPGVGAQGGDLEAVCADGFNDSCGLLINSTRDIIYASNGADFDKAAALKAKQVQTQMADILLKRGW